MSDATPLNPDDATALSSRLAHERGDGATRLSAWANAALVLVLLVTAVGVEVWRDRVYPPADPVESVLYVTSGETLSRLVLSFDALAADLYWVRAVQHFGGTRRGTGPKRYELLYPLLDLTTTLDPRFSIAYRFGSIFLAEPPPGGPGRPDQAIALLEKGIAASPERWQYLHDVAFVHYWWLRDYKAAAAWFERAAAVPGAPWWLKSVAATTLAQGGERQASRALWQLLAESSDNEWLRNDAIRRLRQLEAMDRIDELSRVVADFVRQGGQPPYSWQALVRARMLPGIPLDPTGHAFYVGPYSGTIDVADDSPLAPLPTEQAPPPGSPSS